MPAGAVLVTVCILVALFEAGLCLAILRGQKGKEDQRQKEFALLDKERRELLGLETRLKEELGRFRSETAEREGSLRRMGAEVSLEWESFEQNAKDSLSRALEEMASARGGQCEAVHRVRLALDGARLRAEQAHGALAALVDRSQGVIGALEGKVPKDSLLKELQMASYGEARVLLRGGSSASEVAKTLGLSLGEVSLLSHFV